MAKGARGNPGGRGAKIVLSHVMLVHNRPSSSAASPDRSHRAGRRSALLPAPGSHGGRSGAKAALGAGHRPPHGSDGLTLREGDRRGSCRGEGLCAPCPR